MSPTGALREAYGPPDGGHGGVCSRRGGLSSGDAPPIFFSVLPEKKTGRARSKRKGREARSGAVALRARRGSAYRCKRRFCPAFGHAWVFCGSPNCCPVPVLLTSMGWLSYGPAFLFAAAGCSSRERERQRGGTLRVSQTSPGRRFPQGPGVSVPDFYTGQPTIPRRRQEVCAGADRPAEHFFFSTGRGAFSF